VPTFDSSSSKPSRSEADLLRGVLGPARPRETSLRAASRAYHQAQRRSIARRAAIVAVLLGSFLGSAVVMSRKEAAPVAVATRTLADPETTGSIDPAVRRRDKPAYLVRSEGPEEAADDRP
jgi:hypothetical protein